MTVAPSLPAITLPRLRGWIHLGAALPALAAAIVLVALAPEPGARIATAIYGAGLFALFAGSATYHRWPSTGRVKALLRRIDHSTIYVFIAGSYTPLVVLLLEGDLRVGILLVVWIGALLGVVMSVAWIDAPRWLQAGTYLALGWVAVIVIPAIFAAGGVAAGVLIVVGGAIYSLGAVAYATQRPDPWPGTFGFHEVFHVAVTAAAIVHYVAIALIVL